MPSVYGTGSHSPSGFIGVICPEQVVIVASRACPSGLIMFLNAPGLCVHLEAVAGLGLSPFGAVPPLHRLDKAVQIPQL